MALLGDRIAMTNNTLKGRSGAFYALFSHCTGIISVSEKFLPATTLSHNCYNMMFEGCTNLIKAPNLPSEEMDWWCYERMFSDCISLATAPELPAKTLGDYCYNMMFQGCTSLTVAPTLPATVLCRSCYRDMFYGCTNLNYIKMLAIDVSATDCLYYWVSGVSSSGTFVKNKDAKWYNIYGHSGIPNGWTTQKE
jgi:hypothetical protein